jgi:hypothetical protein
MDGPAHSATTNVNTITTVHVEGTSTAGKQLAKKRLFADLKDRILVDAADFDDEEKSDSGAASRRAAAASSHNRGVPLALSSSISPFFFIIRDLMMKNRLCAWARDRAEAARVQR